MRSWKGLAKLEDTFTELGLTLVGLATDRHTTLARFATKVGLRGGLMLSDPHLATHEVLGIPISRGHPKAKTYPEGAFLQPATFIIDADGQVQHRWVITPKITNIHGAMGRPSPKQMLQTARETLATAS